MYIRSSCLCDCLTLSLSMHTSEGTHMHNRYLCEQGESIVENTQHIEPTNHMRIHTCMPACTHSSFSLLAPRAVSHPSIHVTKRWVHPVTGQLVAVTLIYVAPLSSLFLLWWRDYVCSLPIRKVYSAHNGGPVRKLSQKSPCVSKPYNGFLPWQHHFILIHCFYSFVIVTNGIPEAHCTGLLSNSYSCTWQSIVKGHSWRYGTKIIPCYFEWLNFICFSEYFSTNWAKWSV